MTGEGSESAGQSAIGGSGGESATAGAGGGPASAGGGAGDTCESVRQAAAQALEPTVLANQSCTTHADCGVARGLGGCYDGTFVLGGCYVPVSSSAVEAVAATARELCREADEQGCTSLHPCPAAGPALCLAGTCVLSSR
jgi:hypothetical protein